ncbi:unnamed protein product [Oppiella nova]|uniref:Beta-mannosidase n=1 Tax=Oppiella nova TaxID=334625 RepID=A0A7R9MN34_9ACAR|nr:unnamed protein product [Oppiella nova]CAG2180030.1 unnamed protein product [Oppiella nova]
MNMMRVWGGGVYESDLFYQLADEYGIMIWQDFMFACELSPATPEFLDSVKTEVIQQVRRLQHHPSIAIWAGNNENELFIAVWWHDRPEYYPNYRKLYVDTIGKVLSVEDKTRPYVSSSPSNGLESITENYTAKDPQDKRYGDVHWYNDNSSLWDWTTYPSTKFASEYGFQSYPSIETLLEGFAESDLTFPLTPAVQHHQHKGSYEDALILQHICIDFQLSETSIEGRNR